MSFFTPYKSWSITQNFTCDVIHIIYALCYDLISLPRRKNRSPWPQHSILPAHLSGIHDWSFGRVASAARNWPVLVKQKHPAGFTERNTQHYLLIQKMSFWCDSNSWARPAHCKHEQAKIDLDRFITTLTFVWMLLKSTPWSSTPSRLQINTEAPATRVCFVQPAASPCCFGANLLPRFGSENWTSQMKKRRIM